MKTLILALLGLAAAVIAALAVQDDNGYILIGYGKMTIEGSLAFFLLANFLVFVMLYVLIRFFSRMFSAKRQIGEWRAKRGAKRARTALTLGLVELSEGNWKKAEKDLLKYARRSETPLLNYLAAARSAQQQGAHERRDQYLQYAHESMPSADVAVALTQAELQIDHEQFEQALATLCHLREIAPKHTHVLKLLKELYLRLDDWQELSKLMPDLKKRKVVEQEELQTLELNIYRHQLAQAAGNEDTQQLQVTWNTIPAATRGKEEMVMIYVNHLINRGETVQVEKLLRSTLNRHWSDDLLELYGRVELEDGAYQLNVAEGWLKSHSENPTLLLTLGRLCLRNKLWGKARSYLEASIGEEPSAEAYRELGELLARMGEEQQALGCFRSGLELTSDSPTVELPTSLQLPGSSAAAGASEEETLKLEAVREVAK